MGAPADELQRQEGKKLGNTNIGPSRLKEKKAKKVDKIAERAKEEAPRF